MGDANQTHITLQEAIAMLVEIERFVNWLRRRNPHARTWRDYGYDLKQFVTVVGDRPPINWVSFIFKNFSDLLIAQRTLRIFISDDLPDPFLDGFWCGGSTR